MEGIIIIDQENNDYIIITSFCRDSIIYNIYVELMSHSNEIYGVCVREYWVMCLVPLFYIELQTDTFHDFISATITSIWTSFRQVYPCNLAEALAASTMSPFVNLAIYL